jgi:hypothetical protein
MAYKNVYNTEYNIDYNMDEPILKYPDIYDDNDTEDNKEKKILISTQKEEDTKPKSFYAKFKYHIGLFMKKIYNFCNKIFH